MIYLLLTCFHAHDLYSLLYTYQYHVWSIFDIFPLHMYIISFPTQAKETALRQELQKVDQQLRTELEELQHAQHLGRQQNLKFSHRWEVFPCYSNSKNFIPFRISRFNPGRMGSKANPLTDTAVISLVGPIARWWYFLSNSSFDPFIFLCCTLVPLSFCRRIQRRGLDLGRKDL